MKVLFSFLCLFFVSMNVMAVDQCDNTAQCKTLFGNSATDCKDSKSDNSVCMCGSKACGTTVASSSKAPSSVAPSSKSSSSTGGGGGGGGSGQYGKLVLDQNFNQHTSEKLFTEAVANQDFDLGQRSFRGSGKNTVGNGILRALYPKNKILGQDTGFVFDAFFQSGTEATLEYKVRFDGSFVWSKGGKLPGLGGTTQGQSPTGCTNNQTQIDNGFSARLMWHENGRLVVYTYLPDRSSRCGTPTTFLEGTQRNRWYTIRQYVKLNTPGQKNGVMEIYVDGVLKLRQANLLYRLSGKDAIKVNNILMHTYRGGSTQDWASPQDNTTSFDDFKVWIK